MFCIHRRLVLAAAALVSIPNEARAQAWQAAVSISAASNNQRLRAPVAFGAEIGRDVLTARVAGVGVMLGASYLPSETAYVCTTSPCDIRVLAKFFTANVAVDTRDAHNDWPWYGRASAGRWWGSDANALSDQSSSESGGEFSIEAGYRLATHLTIGVVQLRLQNTRRGGVPFSGVVVRGDF
jgi:hypothetical protein